MPHVPLVATQLMAGVVAIGVALVVSHKFEDARASIHKLFCWAC